jgi:hypothetical protein
MDLTLAPVRFAIFVAASTNYAVIEPSLDEVGHSRPPPQY